MNKQTMKYIGVGLCAGLVLGLVIKPRPSAQPEDSADQAMADKSAKSLLQATEKLNRTTAELHAAKSELEAQKESVRRYSWLMNKWAAKGFANNDMSFQIHSFNPGTGYAEFFGWADELVDEINAIANTTSASIKEWEAANAVYMETEEDKLTYELPSVPETFKEEYLEAMAIALSNEDYALLTTKLETQFSDLENGRRVSLYIGPAPAGGTHESLHQSDKDWMMVEVLHKNPLAEGFLPGSSSMMPYIEGRTIPTQWNHIFQLEIDPNAADITPFASTGGMTMEELGATEVSPIE